MQDNTEDVIRQSAAIPYAVRNGRLQLLLITSRKRRRWIVPKGIVEDWQTPEEAALEEALEEAGVKGDIIGEAVGTYEYDKWGGTCRVDVFLLLVHEVLDSWLESDFRDRLWVGIDDALDMVDNNGLRDVIRLAADMIG
jgi:8-oxo-dGTP pyrophosphatase MutT (NUDIX family)